MADDDWLPSDEEGDEWLAEWEAVDRAAAAYLAERLPEVLEPVSAEDERWLGELAETISPRDAPEESEIEGMSAVMALQHADWLGLALGAARRGAGAPLEAEDVLADVDALDDVEGEIEDWDGALGVIDTALLTLAPKWQELGVLDGEELTERGVWGVPRALHRVWRER